MHDIDLFRYRFFVVGFFSSSFLFWCIRFYFTVISCGYSVRCTFFVCKIAFFLSSGKLLLFDLNVCHKLIWCALSKVQFQDISHEPPKHIFYTKNKNTRPLRKLLMRVHFVYVWVNDSCFDGFKRIINRNLIFYLLAFARSLALFFNIKYHILEHTWAQNEPFNEVDKATHTHTFRRHLFRTLNSTMNANGVCVCAVGVFMVLFFA